MDVARVKALALNAGSSSLKAALYEVEPGAALAVPGAPLCSGASSLTERTAALTSSVSGAGACRRGPP